MWFTLVHFVLCLVICAYRVHHFHCNSSSVPIASHPGLAVLCHTLHSAYLHLSRPSCALLPYVVPCAALICAYHSLSGGRAGPSPLSWGGCSLVLLSLPMPPKATPLCSPALVAALEQAVGWIIGLLEEWAAFLLLHDPDVVSSLYECFLVARVHGSFCLFSNSPDPFLQLGYVSLLGDQSVLLPSTNDLNVCFAQAMGEMCTYALGNWLNRFHGKLGDSSPAICLWDSAVSAVDATVTDWPQGSVHADYQEVMALVWAWVVSGLELE